MLKEKLKNILFWPISPHVTKIISEPLLRYKNRRLRKRSYRLSNIKSVLVVRLDQIGDMVMTTPFLRELRWNLPDAWITIVVTPTVFDLFKNCPYVDEVLACDWEGDRDISRFQRHWKALRLAQKHLWHRQFDLAILPRRGTDQSHGSFLAYFSGAPHRVGYSDNDFDQKLPYFRNTDCLLTHVLNNHTLKHEVENTLEIIRFLGGKIQNDQMEIWLNPEDESFAEQVLKSHEIQSDELLIGFVPGAADSKRMWPLSNFVTLGGWLNEEYHARIVVVGGRGEESLGQELLRRLENALVNTIGKTTLCQAASILKHCHLFIGTDSGLMHLASAVGIPVIEISCHPQNGLSSHSNSPRRFGPWGVPHRILQPEKAIPPCLDSCIDSNAHCILGVTVDQAKKAATELLSSFDQENEVL